MKIAIKELIDVLDKEKNWIDATELSRIFNVSARTIRNYVSIANTEQPGLIQSSHKGYLLNPNAGKYIEQKIKDNNESRVNFIVRQLINSANVISVYDLADQLYISDTQFERVLNDVRNYLNTFNLSIERKRNRIKIAGNELDKRKLINNLITVESTHSFLISNNIHSLIAPDMLNQLQSGLKYILEDLGIFCNDYGFHTILLHIIVMISRVANGNFLCEKTNMIKTESKEHNAIIEINKLIHQIFDMKLPADELYYLALIISNNSGNINTALINIHNIDQFIEPKYIDLTNTILDKLKENYCLDAFSNEFIVNLTIHIRNLLTRALYNTYTSNPLAQKFKEQYPLIYDMATFIIKEINSYQAFRIVDDEIAFIAFHLGSYIENNKIREKKINCCFIYAEYHNMYVRSVEKIINQLHSILYISTTLSITETNKIPKNAELIISCCDQKFNTDLPVVETSIFISDNDISTIRTNAEIIKRNKKRESIKHDLDRFIGKQLFKKNFYCKNNLEMIRILANECIDKKLCEPDYLNDVLEREALSSTSFENGVAIPHSLNANANHSFLYIVSNSNSMKWGNYNVNIIVMIGTAKADRSAFKTIFDGVIELLYEAENVRELIQCETYNEFIDKLVALINI